MNYELLKATIENEAKLQGIEEYEIYYMANEELEVSTLNKEPTKRPRKWFSPSTGSEILKE